MKLPMNIALRKWRFCVLALATTGALAVVPGVIAGGLVEEMKASAQASPRFVTPKAPQQARRFIVTYKDAAQVGVQGGFATQPRAHVIAQRSRIQDVGRRLGFMVKSVRRLGVPADVFETDRDLDAAGIERLRKELLKNPDVTDVSVDTVMQIMRDPDDPGYPEQWHFHDGPGGVNATAAWDSADGLGVVVAVLDTGYTDHLDLVSNIVPGYDFVSDPALGNDGDGRDADAHDPGDGAGPFAPSSWHGTHVAGTVAATTDNGVGVAGVAFGAKVQPVRVLGKGGGYLSDIIDGVIWASGGTVPDVPDNPTPAKVLNMSLGALEVCSPPMQAAINGAAARGATSVVSAGNSRLPARFFTPASCDNVITVAATGPSGERAFYSNVGGSVEIAAPGGTGALPAESNILSTLNSGQTFPESPTYGWYSGTSMSAPHVAGIAALMQSVAPVPLSPAEVREILVNTAFDPSAGPPAGCDWDYKCGTGIADARYSVAVARGDEPLPQTVNVYPEPSVTLTPLQNGVEVTGLSATPSGDIPSPEDSLWFRIDVPENAREFVINTYDGTGNTAVLVARDALPTISDDFGDCTGLFTLWKCSFATPEPGAYFIRLLPDAGFPPGFNDASLQASYLDSSFWPQELTASAGQRGRNDYLQVDLAWLKGASRVDIYRDGDFVKTVKNRGVARDRFRATGSGEAVYMVCNAVSAVECSDPVSLEY